jgi:two-component system, cell cycle sensor histidine kinase and response regulator CckA
MEMRNCTEEQQAPATSIDQQKTILVVDDDPTILTFVSELLSNGGHNILVAVDGRSALELASHHQGEIHLLLSDFEMPHTSGIELASELSLARPAIRVLMMSGFPGGTLVLNEGWHFLPKPFVASQLRSLVMGILFADKSRFRP